jgi:glycosyltransferase involved in cell wall biosynthesis
MVTMQPVRIAIVIDSLAIGGAQKHLCQLACRLAERGHRVAIYVLNNSSDALYTGPLYNAGVRVEVFGPLRVILGVAALRMAWSLWRERTDCLIASLFVSNVIARLVGGAVGQCSILNCLQARNIDYARWQLFLLRATAPVVSATASNSRSAIIWAACNEGSSTRMSRYIPNAVESSSCSTPFQSWTQAGLPELEGQFVVGSVGRLVHQKGYDLLIQAVALLDTHKCKTLRVVIFGEGEQREEMERMISDFGLSGIVHLPGTRRDLPRVLPLLDLFVQPSRFEGAPNALYEALAAGVPCVTSSVDGCGELIGTTGLSVLLSRVGSPGFTLELAAALAEAQGGRFQRTPPRPLFWTVDRLCDAYLSLVRAIQPSNGCIV